METKSIIWIFFIVATFALSDSTTNSNNINICDFETDSLCGWNSTDAKGKFQWVIANGTSVGGQRDHTLGEESGHFLTPVGKPHVQGQAVIVSPWVPKGRNCLKMYIKTRARYSSEFTIYKRIGSLAIPMYRSRGRLYRRWKYIQLDMLYNKEFQIEMTSIQPTGEKGQILLDDVQITPGDCPTTPLSHNNVTCGFEDGQRMCGFEPESSGHVTENRRWVLSNSSNVPLLRDGRGNEEIFRDHTLEAVDGHCLISRPYYNKESGSENNAVIESPYYIGNGSHCLQFYYRMLTPNTNKTNGIGELRVYLVPEGSVRSAGMMRGSWLEGDGNDWTAVNIDYAMDTLYSVVFESTSSTFQTFYAIDDVSIRDHKCPDPASPTTMSTTEYHTSQGGSSTITTADGSTETQKYEIATIQKQTEQKSDHTLIIGLGGGGGLLVLIVVIVVFLTRKRRKHHRGKREKHSRTTSQDIPTEFTSVAFSNPMVEGTFEYGRHNMLPIMEKSNEANA